MTSARAVFEPGVVRCGRPGSRWRACGTRPRPPPWSARSGGCGRGRRSARPISTAAAVVTVPASPTNVARLGRRRASRGARRRRRPRRTDRRGDSSSGCGGSCCEVLLGQAHAADVDRDGRPRTRLAPYENSVEPPPMSTTRNGPRRRVELGGGAEEREPRLLLAREQLGRDADRLLGRVEEVVAVGGVARGRRGRHAHPLDAEAVDDARGTRGARSPCGRSRPGRARPLASTPAPRRVMRISRSMGRQRRRGPHRSRRASATSRRIELVPTSMAALTRRHALDRSPRRRRRGAPSTHAPTGSSPPARNQA